MAGWSVLLEGELAERARRRLEIILHALARTSDGQPAHPSHHDPWISLLYAYAWAERRDRGDLQEHAQAMVAGFQGRLEQGVSGTSLWDGGLAGIAWLNAHIERVFGEPGEPGEDPEDAEDAGDVLDEILTEIVRVSPPPEYDLVSGITGIGMVGVERGASATARALLDAVTVELVRRARSDPSGRTFLTPPELLPPWQRTRAPAGYLNLGVAHGTPGVIGMLAHAGAAGLPTNEELLADLVAWTIAHRDPIARGGRFQSWLPAGSQLPEQSSRTAWCYGGLGVGAVLLLAGHLANRPDWRAHGIDVCLVEAAVSIEASGVVDAGLCHGAAGNAHIFNRLFQSTGDERFGAAALKYYSRLLDYADDTRGIGGYVAFEASPTSGGDGRVELGPAEDASMLTGTAGVGLALLAAVGEIEPRWDRLLLVDLPLPS